MAEISRRGNLLNLCLQSCKHILLSSVKEESQYFSGMLLCCVVLGLCWVWVVLCGVGLGYGYI